MLDLEDECEPELCRNATERLVCLGVEEVVEEEEVGHGEEASRGCNPDLCCCPAPRSCHSHWL